MVWSTEIAKAYSKGLEDGQKGKAFDNNQEFSAAYAEGFLHGESVKRLHLK